MMPFETLHSDAGTFHSSAAAWISIMRAVAPPTKERRLSIGISVMATPLRVRGGVNRGAHLLECAAATDIGDRIVDIGIGRLRLVLEQRRHRHDHAALAIAALRHVVVDP